MKKSFGRTEIRDLRLVCILGEKENNKLEWSEYAEKMEWNGKNIIFPYVRLFFGATVIGF
jgi:hypothetical protein